MLLRQAARLAVLLSETGIGACTPELWQEGTIMLLAQTTGRSLLAEPPEASESP